MMEEHIKAKVDALLAEKFDETIKGAIDKLIKDGFNREYQKVNAFGEPEGPKTSISTELERMITDYWTQTVDRNGQPTKSSYRGMTRAEYVMTIICAEDFSAAVKDAVIEREGEFKDAIRTALVVQTDKMLNNLMPVRSNYDDKDDDEGTIKHKRKKKTSRLL
jgi:hypothetical protein